MKKIALIIVTYNSRTKIADCLNSVFAQNFSRESIQVVLVDNHSTDSTLGFVKEKYPQIKIIENRENVGFAQANNQGYGWAKKNGCQYHVLLNDDTIVERNWLFRLAKILDSDPEIGAAQAKLMLYPEKELINSFGNCLHFLGFAFCNRYREKDREGIIQPFEIPYASGAACILRMSALEKVGLFEDKFFMYHEDADLGWRLRLNGWKIVLDPLAVVWHKYNFSKAKYKFYYMERNRKLLLLINYRIPTLILLLPPLLMMELGIFFFSLKNHWFNEKISGCLWVIFHLPWILSRRFEVQFKIRKASDRKILELYTGSIKFEAVDNPILKYAVNPLNELYFFVIKRIIFW